ncbi:MAG TPA: ATP-binding protein [Opitutaceae bacterium]|nr:ATP-binding protein [Opitutaceae bacterium]
MVDRLPVPVDVSTAALREARGLSTRADSRRTMVGFVLGFVGMAAGWLMFAAWIQGHERAASTLAPWMLTVAPGLGVLAICVVLLAVVMRRARVRQRQLMRELREAETMLLTSQRLETFGVLAASMAHDFNNTLTVIRGMADLAKLESYEPKVSKSALDAIQLATFRAEEIAHHLIDFLSKPKDLYALRDLNVVVREFSSISQQAAGARTIVAYELEEGLPATQLNRGMIEQALLNLVINARDAVAKSDSPRIKISSKSVELIEQVSPICPTPVSGRFVELSVTDNGCGIPDRDLARAFVPFYTTKRHGTGLGLPSVLRAVRQHDGFVDVRSKVGTGTTVRLLIPVRSEPRTDTASEAPAAFQRAVR